MSDREDEDEGFNGKGYLCPLRPNGEWGKHTVKALIAMDQINEIHGASKTFLDNIKHLEKLNALSDIKESLLSYVVGRDQISTKVVNELFEQQHKTFRTTQIVTGIVVVGLIGVIVFLLTGEQLGWIHGLFKQAQP